MPDPRIDILEYHEIRIAVDNLDVDAVANYIIENISTGMLLEEEEASPITGLRFYVSAEESIDVKLNALQRYLRDVSEKYADVSITRRTIKNLDWIETYQQSVALVEIGESIVVRPPWNTDALEGKTIITIEPKMAFGTGTHETSQSCLAELEQLDLTGKAVLDLGCGSGILGIYAALRGAASVEAFDIDPLAIENSRENFVLNSVANICTAELGSLSAVGSLMTYDIVVVNIIRKVILPIMGKLKKMVRPSGYLILSGLLQSERTPVETALAEHGLDNYSTRLQNEWITYTISF